MNNLKNRYEYVADFINQNNYKIIVEVGLEAGASAQYILQTCSSIEKYYGIDIVKPWNFPDEIFSKFKNFEFVHLSSHEASQNFEDKSIDLAYIDANHDYENVIEDITDWLPKIREGGIICGHDYSNSIYPSVVKAVNEKFPEGVNLLLDQVLYGLLEPDDYIWWKQI